MYQTMELSLQDAMVLLNDVRQNLEKNDLGAAVAVVDAHGELIAFVRTRGCPLPSINNAINKAYASARERIESGALGQRSRDEDWQLTNFGDLRYTGWAGGVPIVFEGQVIGAIGISGLPEADDLALARHAVAAWRPAG